MMHPRPRLLAFDLDATLWYAGLSLLVWAPTGVFIVNPTCAGTLKLI